MSTVTPILGLVKPTTLEQYALSILNNNMDLIDAATLQIDKVNSTLDNANFNMTSSTFVRFRVGTEGLIVARIRCLSDAAVALPINTAAASNAGVVVPAGYMPKESVELHQAIQSGAGRGDEVQISLNTSGQLLLRANTGSGLTTTIGAAINWNVVYEWDGVV